MLMRGVKASSAVFDLKTSPDLFFTKVMHYPLRPQTSPIFAGVDLKIKDKFLRYEIPNKIVA